MLEEAERIAHVGYWERDLSTGLITFSKEASSIFGLMPREGAITIEEVIERLHPEDRAIWNSAVAETLCCGSRYDLNYRIVRPDGEVRFVHSQGNLMADESGRPPRMFGAIQDITDLKRAEHLAQLIFERSPDAICIVGKDLRYQRVNPVFESFVGRPARDIVGKHVSEIIGTAFFEQTSKPMLTRCLGGEEVRYADWVEFPFLCDRRYLSLSYSPLGSKSDRVDAILLIFRDLTDYALASEALRSSQAELAHANRIATMGQLTASIAHEVNQPISAALMNAQAALAWLDANPSNLRKVRESLYEIVDNATRAGEVVDRIRGFVKKAPLRKESIDINSVVVGVMALTRGEVLEHGLSLQTDLATNLPPVEGDRVQLQQVILNLIMNAVDAMSCLAEGARELCISTTSNASDRVLVSVRDTGPGLHPKVADRVFEAFCTTKPEGMGMGLAICRSIIEAHGGLLWTTANEPRGAVFHFCLPFKQNPPLRQGYQPWLSGINSQDGTPTA